MLQTRTKNHGTSEVNLQRDRTLNHPSLILQNSCSPPYKIAHFPTLTTSQSRSQDIAFRWHQIFHQVGFNPHKIQNLPMLHRHSHSIKHNQHCRFASQFGSIINCHPNVINISGLFLTICGTIDIFNLIISKRKLNLFYNSSRKSI